jgi:ribosomal protein S18 acetylase RimI-like enzyme
LTIREIGPDDFGPVCELVAADALPGQAPCSPDRVAAVAAGRSLAGAWRWEQLTGVRTLVAVGPGGEVAGAGAVGRGADGHPHLLWLHAREDRATLDALLFNLFRGLRRSAPAYAFDAATDLAPAVEGLPAGRRPVTAAALAGRGFVGRARWLYLCADGAGPEPAVPIRVTGRGGDLRVEASEGGAPVGAAEVSRTGPATGVIWWLEVEPPYRRAGYGRAVLRGARRALAETGASSTVLLVDLEAHAAREREWALSLYHSEGFAVADELWSYQRGPAA